MNSQNVILFQFADYWWFYIAFICLVLVLISVDLGLFGRRTKALSMRTAAIRTFIWVALALTFNVLMYLYADWAFKHDPRLMAIPGFDPDHAAKHVALEFLTGYVVEQALSMDNIFVFVVVFMYFGIEEKYQHRVLLYGILGALILRGIFIALGSILMQYEPIIYVFGAFLIFTGIQLLRSGDKEIEPDKNIVIKFLKKFIPLTEKIDGKSFFVKVNGKLHMTPLFITLIFLEMTDVVFAVDSVPAIFAITREPLIVFTSNIFAILGLRSLYFLLSGAITLFHFLKYGLALVLVFVGLKMVWLNHAFGGKFPILYSLVIIISVIAGSIIASLLFPKKK